ncbi:MAG: helix-hairpin-helix domain-containing protein [Bacteroidota bacterium]
MDMFNAEYFRNIDSPDGLFFWLMMLVFFFLGFLIAYLLRSAKVRRLKKELRQQEEQQKILQTQLTSAQEQLTARNAELQEESRERVDLMERLQQADSQKQQHLTEVFQLNKQIEELQASNRTYHSSVEELNEQIALLQTQNDEEGDSTSTIVTLPVTTTEGTIEANQLDNRLTEFEATLGRLSAENAQLKQDLESLKNNNASQPTGETTSTSAEEPVLQVQTDKTVLYEKIIVSDREQDDLTKIDGVGDFLAAKLHAAGVFSFEEIAAWTPERIQQITEEIGYLPGRIEKDQWVVQAAGFIQGNASSPRKVTPEEEVSTTAIKASKPAKKTKTKESSDLKIIEGIGPKIEEVLKAAGITDWAELAATEPGRLKEILEEAGGRFRMHNPYTWPLQARLAAAGRWEEFEQYQEELKGGKE